MTSTRPIIFVRLMEDGRLGFGVMPKLTPEFADAVAQLEQVQNVERSKLNVRLFLEVSPGILQDGEQLGELMNAVAECLSEDTLVIYEVPGRHAEGAWDFVNTMQAAT